MANNKIYIESDNLVTITGLQNVQTGAYINSGTVEMSVFESATVTPDVDSTLENSSGSVKIKITGTTLTTDNFVRIQGSKQYDGQFNITSLPDADHIVVDATYVADESANGVTIYVGVISNGKDIALSYKTDSDGIWEGTIPDTTRKIIYQNDYYVFISADDGSGVDLLSRLKWSAVFHPFGV